MPDNVVTDDKKFLFHLNVFDDTIEGDLDPEGVTLLEEELEKLRQEQFQKGQNEGRTQALEESKNSRDQYIANLLETISKSTATLFDAEAQREKIYETEAVSLAFAIFEKLFPIYAEKSGLTELKQGIANILQAQEGQKDITVFVAPEDKSDIEAHIQNLSGTSAGRIHVEDDETLSTGACRLAWRDGGAIKDAHALAEEIRVLIGNALADQSVSGHDSEDDLPKEAKASHNDDKSLSEPDSDDLSEPPAPPDEPQDHDNDLMETPDE